MIFFIKEQIFINKLQHYNLASIIILQKQSMSIKKSQFLKDQLDAHLAHKISNENFEFYQRQNTKSQSHQIKFYENLNFPAYKKSDKLDLGMERINRIKDQLNLHQEAKVMFNNRIQSEDYYLQYTFNPFIMYEEPFPQNKVPATKKRQNNIIQGIKDTKKKSKKEVIEQRIKKLELSFNDCQSKKIQLQIKKLHNQSVNIPFEEELNTTKRHYRSDIDFQFLDSIVKRKEEIHNFVDFSKKKMNIFQLIKGKSLQQFPNCRQALKKLKFCHDSIMHNPENKQGLTTFQQISVISRKFIRQKHDQIISQHRLHSASMLLKLDQLNFEHIMLASTGILQPQQLANYMNGHVEVSDSTEVVSLFYNNPNRKEPIYRQNNKNIQILYQHQSNDTFLQQNLKKIPWREKEIKQMELSKQLKEKIEQVLKKEHILACYGINDRSVREEITSAKRQIIDQQILNYKKNKNQPNIHQTSIDIDKKIRVSKRYKDRSQNIKNYLIQQTLKVVQKEQEKMKPAKVRQRKKRFLEPDFSFNNISINKNRSLAKSNQRQSSSCNSKNKSVSFQKVSKGNRFMRF